MVAVLRDRDALPRAVEAARGRGRGVPLKDEEERGGVKLVVAGRHAFHDEGAARVGLDGAGAELILVADAPREDAQRVARRERPADDVDLPAHGRAAVGDDDAHARHLRAFRDLDDALAPEGHAVVLDARHREVGAPLGGEADADAARLQPADAEAAVRGDRLAGRAGRPS